MKRMMLGWIAYLCAVVAVAAEPAANPVENSDDKATVPTEAQPVQTSRSARPDRLDLEMTVVTGNRELPKVLYIVPWKKAELGELPAQPFNTLLDETLMPVDRDVFRREVTYYESVAADQRQADETRASSATSRGGSEK